MGVLDQSAVLWVWVCCGSSLRQAGDRQNIAQREDFACGLAWWLHLHRELDSFPHWPCVGRSPIRLVRLSHSCATDPGGCWCRPVVDLGEVRSPRAFLEEVALLRSLRYCCIHLRSYARSRGKLGRHMLLRIALLTCSSAVLQSLLRTFLLPGCQVQISDFCRPCHLSVYVRLSTRVGYRLPIDHTSGSLPLGYLGRLVDCHLGCCTSRTHRSRYQDTSLG